MGLGGEGEEDRRSKKKRILLVRGERKSVGRQKKMGGRLKREKMGKQKREIYSLI